MKCKRQWKYCVKKSKTCKEKLKCYWLAYRCIKKCKSYSPTKPTYKMYKRKWNPDIMAKCKKGFNQCLNTTNSTCPQEIGCFIGMKKCIMDGHRPTPCPKMMKCKTEFYRCKENASSTCEEIECMKSKHECFENIRPTKPPMGDDDDDDDEDDDGVKMGYKPRKRWVGKWAEKRKCMKRIYEECLNTDKDCTEKMSCYMEMKRNKCMPVHVVRKAAQDFARKVMGHFHRFHHGFLSMAKPIVNRFRNRKVQLKKRFRTHRAKLMKSKLRNRAKEMMNNNRKRVEKMKDFFRKSTDGIKKKFKSIKDRWGGKKGMFG